MYIYYLLTIIIFISIIPNIIELCNLLMSKGLDESRWCEIQVGVQQVLP